MKRNVHLCLQLSLASSGSICRLCWRWWLQLSISNWSIRLWCEPSALAVTCRTWTTHFKRYFFLQHTNGMPNEGCCHLFLPCVVAMQGTNRLKNSFYSHRSSVNSTVGPSCRDGLVSQPVCVWINILQRKRVWSLPSSWKRVRRGNQGLLLLSSARMLGAFRSTLQSRESQLSIWPFLGECPLDAKSGLSWLRFAPTVVTDINFALLAVGELSA